MWQCFVPWINMGIVPLSCLSCCGQILIFILLGSLKQSQQSKTLCWTEMQTLLDIVSLHSLFFWSSNRQEEMGWISITMVPCRAFRIWISTLKISLDLSSTLPELKCSPPLVAGRSTTGLRTFQQSTTEFCLHTGPFWKHHRIPLWKHEN